MGAGKNPLIVSVCTKVKMDINKAKAAIIQTNGIENRMKNQLNTPQPYVICLS